jgi:hypothetical protein
MKTREYGQTIIEVLVALSTAVIIVSATTVAVLTALHNAQHTQVQNTATRYSQEGLEFMRYLRDSNYIQFTNIADDTLYCLDKGATAVYKATDPNTCGGSFPVKCGDNLDLYSRSIVIHKNAPNCAPIPPTPPGVVPVNTSSEVTVMVSWTDGQCPSACPCHESKLVSCLSDYTIAPTLGDNIPPTPTP